MINQNVFMFFLFNVGLVLLIVVQKAFAGVEELLAKIVFASLLDCDLTIEIIVVFLSYIDIFTV